MTSNYHTLNVDRPIWDRFFTVSPLVLIGSKNEHGGFNLAPKHMVTPLGWENLIGFVCTPRHRTYTNIQREQVYTFSYIQPTQIVLSSLAAAPRADDGSKSLAAVLETDPAQAIDGIRVKDAYLHLECELIRIYDDFGDNSLIAGKILAAQVHVDHVRVSDRDDHEIPYQTPLLAYLDPGRYATIRETYSFPFHKGMRK